VEPEVASLAVIPLYRDLLQLSTAAPQQFGPLACRTFPTFFGGLWETYGPELFGPSLPQALQALRPSLTGALQGAATLGLEQSAEVLLEQAGARLPGPAPECYLGTLLFTGPAATVGIGGAPAIVVGMERFTAQPPAGQPKQYYYPAELAEMIPHEAAHVARMGALDLPLSPKFLSLLEMCMLEGTALHFADSLVGRPTLATFMPAERIAWHEANREAVRQWVAGRWREGGLGAFQDYFGSDANLSGYWIGYDLCRRYLDRYGRDSLGELITMPSSLVLTRLDDPVP
jgi:hypothetical protein